MQYFSTELMGNGAFKVSGIFNPDHETYGKRFFELVDKMKPSQAVVTVQIDRKNAQAFLTVIIPRTGAAAEEPVKSPLGPGPHGSVDPGLPIKPDDSELVEVDPIKAVEPLPGTPGGVEPNEEEEPEP